MWKIKTKSDPPRSVSHHIRTGIALDLLEKIFINYFIKEHSSNEPVAWASCVVIVPKDDRFLLVTLDF